MYTCVPGKSRETGCRKESFDRKLIVTKRVEKDRENGKRRKDSIRKYGILNDSESALEELADFARKMEPTEYAYFYRLMERMENNVEICILVRDDRLEKLEAILRRDWNLVKRMYGDMWKMDLQNEKERYRFLQLLTEIEWYLEGKGLMRMEEKRYGYAN